MRIKEVLAGRLFLSSILLTFSLSGFAAAISAFDVIHLTREGYPDEEIIRLIHVTESGFALSADDAVRLRKEGVSEAVIREMLARSSPEESPSAGEEGRPAPGRQEDHSHDTDTRPPGGARVVGSGHEVSLERSSEALFEAGTYEEAASGHHAHASVSLGGLPVLIVRDEAGFHSPLERAQAIARNLAKLAANPKGRFAARGREVVFAETATLETLIVTVSRGDAIAYGRRSIQKTTPEMLASFWSALLNDYWLMAVAGKPPRYLTQSHEGQALEELYRDVENSEQMPAAEAIRSALASLPLAKHEHLRRLPTVIPEELSDREGRSP